MAIVSRGGGGGGAGGGATRDAGGGPEQVRTNRPPGTGPIWGRKAEMQAVVDAFAKAQKAQRSGTVEICGPAGSGATSVAVELARRAGGRFPGGAWLLRADLGPDLAWADLAACRVDRPIRDLASTAAEERRHFAAPPRALLVVDGVTAGAPLDAILPPDSDARADVFLVSDEPSGRFEAVVRVSPVPEHAPRRIAHSVLRVRDGDDLVPPIVRSTDGLAVTASLAARVSVFHHPQGPARNVASVQDAVMQIVPMAAQHPAALELLLVCGVAHPTLITADALYGALVHLRRQRGIELKDDDVGNGVLHLVRLGLLTLEEESRVSMHPLLQEVVRGMARSEADLEVAREGLAAGLIEEADAAIGDDGVDVRRAGLHQLRHLRDATEGALRERLDAAVQRVEAALGMSA